MQLVHLMRHRCALAGTSPSPPGADTLSIQRTQVHDCLLSWLCFLIFFYHAISRYESGCTAAGPLHDLLSSGALPSGEKTHTTPDAWRCMDWGFDRIGYDCPI